MFPCKDCLLISNCSQQCQNHYDIIEVKHKSMTFVAEMKQNICPHCSGPLKNVGLYKLHQKECPRCNHIFH